MAKKSRRKKMINVAGHRLKRLEPVYDGIFSKRKVFIYRCECGAIDDERRPAGDSRLKHYYHAVAELMKKEQNNGQ